MEDTKDDKGKSDYVNESVDRCDDEGSSKSCSECETKAVSSPSNSKKRHSYSPPPLDLLDYHCPEKKVKSCDHDQEQDGFFLFGCFIPVNRPKEEGGEGKDTTKIDKGKNPIVSNNNKAQTYEVGSSSSLHQTWRPRHHDRSLERNICLELTLMSAGDVARKKEKRRPKPKPRKEDYPSSPTPLPQEVMDMINRTRGGGNEPIHVSTKRITPTDVDRHQGRLNITQPGNLATVFTPEELGKVQREGSKGLEVKVMDACGRKYTMRMRKRSYSVAIALNHEWNKLVSQNGLEEDDWVEIWWFRETNDEICLVLNVIKKRRDDDGNDDDENNGGGMSSSSNFHGGEGGSGSSVACSRKFYNFL